VLDDRLDHDLLSHHPVSCLRSPAGLSFPRRLGSRETTTEARYTGAPASRLAAPRPKTGMFPPVASRGSRGRPTPGYAGVANAISLALWTTGKRLAPGTAGSWLCLGVARETRTRTEDTTIFSRAGLFLSRVDLRPFSSFWACLTRTPFPGLCAPFPDVTADGGARRPFRCAGQARHGRWTTGDYIKVCAERRSLGKARSAGPPSKVSQARGACRSSFRGARAWLRTPAHLWLSPCEYQWRPSRATMR
jgi:hypothetical protein